MVLKKLPDILSPDGLKAAVKLIDNDTYSLTFKIALKQADLIILGDSALGKNLKSLIIEAEYTPTQ